MANPDRPRPYIEIANRLRTLREVEGVDQKVFAEKVGATYSQYKNWESGASRIGLDGAIKVVAALPGLSLDYIYLGDVASLAKAWRNEVESRSQV